MDLSNTLLHHAGVYLKNKVTWVRVADPELDKRIINTLIIGGERSAKSMVGQLTGLDPANVRASMVDLAFRGELDVELRDNELVYRAP